ncbi:Cell number regulator 8-like protein [Drosera capensis]
MATDPNPDESAPLLPTSDFKNPVNEDPSSLKIKAHTSPLNQAALPQTPKPAAPAMPHVVAEGLPFEGFVVNGGRRGWDSGIGNCMGRRDEFYGTDLEVCVLGTLAPCVLHGSNVERLESVPGSFANHCMSYAALYMIGNFLYGWNCLAPWLSYRNRSALRRRFNLEGNFESFARTHGCCEGILDDDVRREQWEAACDLGTHIFCHTCALCQEGREIRRRLPHPAFNAQPIIVMVPPGQQAMGRDAA